MKKKKINFGWIISITGGIYGFVSSGPTFFASSTIFRAVEDGGGKAALPDFYARESRSLVRVLPELEGPGYDAFFVYPEELKGSSRIRVFRDFLVRKVAETRF